MNDLMPAWIVVMAFIYLFFFAHKKFRKPYIAGFLTIIMGAVLWYLEPTDNSYILLGSVTAFIGIISLFNNKKGFDA